MPRRAERDSRNWDTCARDNNRIRGKIEDVSVPTRAEDNRIGEVRLYFSCDQVSSGDASGLSVDDDQVQHLHSREHRHFSRGDLAEERLIRAQQKLLACLTTRI